MMKYIHMYTESNLVFCRIVLCVVALHLPCDLVVLFHFSPSLPPPPSLLPPPSPSSLPPSQRANPEAHRIQSGQRWTPDEVNIRLRKFAWSQ